MFAKLLLLFTVGPLVELLVLIEVGKRIGTWETLAVVLLTGIFGAALAKQQGLATLFAIQQEMRDGRVPAGALLEGLFVLIGAVTLVTPGLITDAIGFSFLLPATRRLWRGAIERRVEYWLRTGVIRII
jgi:UPF0716 protein FxsA